MAATYTQFYVHLVFVVKYRNPLIESQFRENIEKYISGIIDKQGNKLLAIYCMPDNAHILIRFKPNQNISDLVRDIKSNSSVWIKHKGFVRNFQWQSGYGGFTIAKSEARRVITYIIDQESHHKKKSLKDEYIELLESHGVDYDLRYILSD